MGTPLTKLNNAVKRGYTPGMNILRVAAAVAATETVTVGASVWEVYTGSTPVTAGRIAVDVSAGGTKGTGTLTSDNTNVSDADTVTIGTKVYTFKTALTPTEGEVLIGADADGSLLNLIRAINHTGTPNTDYKCAAANTFVTAAAAVTSHAFAVTARVTGIVSIASTESAAHLSWGAATLAGGANPTAAQFVAAFVAATNAAVDSPIDAVQISTSEVLCYTRRNGSNPASTETLAGSNNVWDAVTFFGGDKPGTIPGLVAQSRLALATEVTLQTMHFVFGFTVTGAVIQIRNTDGTVKVSDGAMTISGKRVTWASSGSTDVDADDIVSVLAW